MVKDVPGCPMVEALCSNTGGVDSISDQRVKVQYALRPEKKKKKHIKQKQYCNKFSKYFKNSPQQKYFKI